MLTKRGEVASPFLYPKKIPCDICDIKVKIMILMYHDFRKLGIVFYMFIDVFENT